MIVGAEGAIEEKQKMCVGRVSFIRVQVSSTKVAEGRSLYVSLVESDGEVPEEIALLCTDKIGALANRHGGMKSPLKPFVVHLRRVWQKWRHHIAF